MGLSQCRFADLLSHRSVGQTSGHGVAVFSAQGCRKLKSRHWCGAWGPLPSSHGFGQNLSTFVVGVRFPFFYWSSLGTPLLEGSHVSLPYDPFYRLSHNIAVSSFKAPAKPLSCFISLTYFISNLYSLFQGLT